MMQNLRRNVPDSVGVVPHKWGDPVDALIENGLFDVILLADCLWMPEEHASLCETLAKTLKQTSSARVHCVAGFHSGRQKMAPFFQHATKVGLVTDSIYEINTTGERRDWDPSRAEEDSVVRKKWLTIATLKWITR